MEYRLIGGKKRENGHEKEPVPRSGTYPQSKYPTRARDLQTQIASVAEATIAPRWMLDTPAQAELRRYSQAHRPMVVLVRDPTKQGRKRNIMQLGREGRGAEFLAGLRQARSEVQLTYQQYHQLQDEGREILRDPHYGPLRNSFNRLDLGEALRVYSLANPEEQRVLYPLMASKWSHDREETRSQHREEFNALREKLAGNQ